MVGCNLPGATHTFSDFMVNGDQYAQSVFNRLFLDPEFPLPDNAVLTGDNARAFLLDNACREWLKAGLGLGIARPCFRAGLTSFEESWTRMRETERTHRDVHRPAQSRGEDPFGQAISALDQSRYQPGPTLTTESPRLLRTRLKERFRLWERLEVKNEAIPYSWRTDLFEKTIRRTAERNVEGVLLTEYLDVMCDELVPDTEKESIRNPRALLSHKAVRPMHQSLELFWRVLCQEYNQAQAHMLGCDVSLANYDYRQAILDSAGREEEISKQIEDVECFVLGELWLPTYHEMKTLPATELEVFRRLGESYFRALEVVLESPSRHNAETCGRELVAYGDRVHRLAKSLTGQTRQLQVRALHGVSIALRAISMSVAGTDYERAFSTVGFAATALAILRSWSGPRDQNLLLTTEGGHLSIHDLTRQAPV